MNKLETGVKVKVLENDELIDEGIILGVGLHGKRSFRKIEFKSSILKIEGIIEFITFSEDDDGEEWYVLFKNPMHPAEKITSDCLPTYKFKPI
ncbi:MAG: hypothetical protein ACOYL8_02945 [Patescibacteria group bacterium]